MRMFLIIVVLMMGCRDGSGGNAEVDAAEWVADCEAYTLWQCGCADDPACGQVAECQGMWTDEVASKPASCQQAVMDFYECRAEQACGLVTEDSPCFPELVTVGASDCGDIDF